MVILMNKNKQNKQMVIYFTKISSKNNASVVSSMTHSTDYTNSPPSDHVQDVIPTANNNILESTEESNTNAQSISS